MILCVCPNPAIDKLVEIENFKKGINRVNKEYSYPGGKGVHVALGVKELGEEVALLGFWGGLSGQWIKQECLAKGIVCYGPNMVQPSRTCLTIKTTNDFRDTEIIGSRPIIDALKYSRFLKEYKRLIKTSEIVSFSGSWPNNAICANYASLIEIASKLKIDTFVDCSGDELSEALKKKPFAVHINHHEGNEIYNTYDPISISQKVGANCELSAITFGQKGLYLSKNYKLVHALCDVKEVISTVGSGDSLLAGIIVAHKRKYTLVETAKLGAASGAANCIRKELGMFHRKDVEHLFQNCEVTLGKLDKVAYKDGKKI